ncbi:MAG TPA: Fmu (Sun) domain protein [Chitinophagaceae bacterium]
MKLPELLVNSLDGVKGFDKEAFINLHESGERVTSIRINPSKNFDFPISGFELSQVPWSNHGYYLSQRPSFTFDPFFHSGCYYVQEASSMFIEQALKQTVNLSQPLKILDLAAAPGGKSTHIQSLMSADSLLVSNDVIRSRSHILKDNIIKWGTDNVVVTNNDPQDFSALVNYFDIIVVDAPCSGSGLFRRDKEAIGEWNKNNVQLCCGRQRRILSDVWPALKNNGILVYSTCSYSKEEDEDIIDWIKTELSEGVPQSIASFQLSIDPQWKIIESGDGYRFWPDKVKGEGFFLACVKKQGEDHEKEIRLKRKLEPLTRKEMEIVNHWVKKTDHEYVKMANTVYSVPGPLVKNFTLLINELNVVYFGILIGELVRDKLIPAHALAMSALVSDNVESMELNKEETISYLQKKDLGKINASAGWKLITYKNHSLGWVNVLPNRINNYYPKELRILKDI